MGGRPSRFQGQVVRIETLLNPDDLSPVQSPDQLFWSSLSDGFGGHGNWVIRGHESGHETLWRDGACVISRIISYSSPITSKITDPLDPNLWWHNSRWHEFNGPLLVMADGTLVGIGNHLFKRSHLLWTDRLDWSVHSICELPKPHRQVTALAADVDKKRILYLNSCPNELCQITGLPVAWFAPKSHLHNWRRLAFFLSFIRANRTHLFANSGLHLVSSVLYFLNPKTS